tara:strand:- start:612 stop:1196 length:585 start_codon:yes stop_codon:yes gene_type:complete
MKNLKFLPHLSLIAVIIFLMIDTSFFFFKTPSIAKKNQSHAVERSHQEGNKNKDLTQEEKERRMGIFHYNEGNKSFKAGQFEEAIINYKKALHHNKNFKEATINLSTAYMRNSDFEATLKTLQKGIMLDPKNPHIHYNYACYYSLIKQSKTSLKKLKEAIELGFDQFKQIQTDPDLEYLRKSDEFKNWAKILNI